MSEIDYSPVILGDVKRTAQMLFFTHCGNLFESLRHHFFQSSVENGAVFPFDKSYAADCVRKRYREIFSRYSAHNLCSFEFLRAVLRRKSSYDSDALCPLI